MTDELYHQRTLCPKGQDEPNLFHVVPTRVQVLDQGHLHLARWSQAQLRW